MSANDIGPFKNLSGDDLSKFFNCMQTMTLSFGYKNTHLQYNHPLTYALSIQVINLLPMLNCAIHSLFWQLLYDNSVQGGRIALTMSWTKDSLTTLPYAQLLQLYKVYISSAAPHFSSLPSSCLPLQLLLLY